MAFLKSMQGCANKYFLILAESMQIRCCASLVISTKLILTYIPITESRSGISLLLDGVIFPDVVISSQLDVIDGGS